MPKGIYERTEEHKIKIGLAHRGMKHSDEAKKKMGDSHITQFLKDYAMGDR
jgi:hypothetical protein